AVHLELVAREPDVAPPGEPMSEVRRLLHLARLEVRKIRHLPSSKPHLLDFGGRQLHLLTPWRLDLPGGRFDLLPSAPDRDLARQQERLAQVVAARFWPRRDDEALYLLKRQGARLPLVEEAQPVPFDPFQDSGDRDDFPLARLRQEQVFRPARLPPLGERFGG